jgi:glycosyltransferase involved in cell wall biosynthesis
MDIRAAFGGHNPDFILILKDAHWCAPGQYRGWNTGNWCNIDMTPMSLADQWFFRESGALPIAVSKFGLSQMRAAGLANPAYIPHGIDCGFWAPGDQATARRLLGLPEGVFIAGINAMNLGTPGRKAFYEQFSAFASFVRQLQPEALLLAHTNPDHPEGMPLRAIVDRLGITDSVLWAKDMNQPEMELRNWYRSLDVLMNATYGEGFGIPVCEALACGVPVIGTDCSALTEKIPAGAGWLARGQKFWVPGERTHPHGGDWTVPAIGHLTALLAHAAARRFKPAPEYGAQWDAARITREYWKPALEELCG